MTTYTTCPACNYTRKPTDDAPEWECPNCQKAYAKTAHALNSGQEKPHSEMHTSVQTIHAGSAHTEKKETDPVSLQFSDPVAEKTEWTRVDKTRVGFDAYTGYPAYRLIRVNAMRVEFQPTFVGKMSPAMEIIMGIVFVVFLGFAGIHLVKESFSTGLVVIGIVFLLAVSIAVLGVRRFRDFLMPRVFDKSAGLFWKGKTPPFGGGDKEKPKFCVALGEIYSIQIVSEYRRENKHGPYYTYELNLVFRDGKRFNLDGHANLDVIRQQAANLSRFLEKPIWDATEDGYVKEINQPAINGLKDESPSSVITCPACNYTRKPTDDAPVWQCPNCKKAYVRTAQAPELKEMAEKNFFPIKDSGTSRSFPVLSEERLNSVNGPSENRSASNQTKTAAGITKDRSSTRTRLAGLIFTLLGIGTAFAATRQPGDETVLVLIICSAFVLVGMRFLIWGEYSSTGNASFTFRVFVFLICMSTGIIITAMAFQNVHIEMHRGQNGIVTGSVTRTYFGIYKVAHQYSGIKNASSSINNITLHSKSGDIRIFYGIGQDYYVLKDLEQRIDSFLSDESKPNYTDKSSIISLKLGVFGISIDLIGLIALASIVGDIRRKLGRSS